MAKETRYLNHDGALICAQNWRFFGLPFKITKLAWNRYKVSTKPWIWSQVHLVEEDYA